MEEDCTVATVAELVVDQMHATEGTTTFKPAVEVHDEARSPARTEVKRPTNTATVALLAGLEGPELRERVEDILLHQVRKHSNDAELGIAAHTALTDLPDDTPSILECWLREHVGCAVELPDTLFQDHSTIAAIAEVVAQQFELLQMPRAIPGIGDVLMHTTRGQGQVTGIVYATGTIRVQFEGAETHGYRPSSWGKLCDVVSGQSVAARAGIRCLSEMLNDSKIPSVGEALVHQSRGPGKVVRVEDVHGEIGIHVMFERGDVHRYQAHSWHKLYDAGSMRPINSNIGLLDIQSQIQLYAHRGVVQIIGSAYRIPGGSGLWPTLAGGDVEIDADPPERWARLLSGSEAAGLEFMSLACRRFS